MFLFSFELLVPLIVIGLIVVVIAAFAGDRREPDPTGRRPYAVYLFAVSFVALFLLLSSGLGMVSAIVRIGLPDHNEFVEGFAESSGFGVGQKVAAVPVPAPGQEQPLSPNPSPEFRPFDPDKEHIRQAVQTGLVAIAAGLVLLFHARRARELVHEPRFAEGPARRTYQVYLYAVCFVSILTALVAAALAVYGFVRIVAPGTTSFGPGGTERDEGIHQLVTSGVLALAALAIFQFHWRRTSTGTPPAAEAPSPA